MTSNTLKNHDYRGLHLRDSGRWTGVQRLIASRFAISLSLFTYVGLFLVGCNQGEDGNSKRKLVAPIMNQFPYEFHGKVGYSWGGDEYQVYHKGVVHWVRLVGVNGPEPGQALHNECRRKMWNKSYKKKATVVIHSVDEAKCEIGSVVVDDTDLSLCLIQLGYGWYDGSDCEHSAEYEAAEQEARAKGIGVWQNESPVDPIEFRKQDLEFKLDRLRREIAN